MTPPVYGLLVDDKTRCVHYASALDVVAIRFKCCGRYYPCYACHAAVAGHPAQVWPQTEWHEKAILCGECKCELTIKEYMDANHQCPHCESQFNPGCSNHYHLYFEGIRQGLQPG